MLSVMSVDDVSKNASKDMKNVLMIEETFLTKWIVIGKLV